MQLLLEQLSFLKNIGNISLKGNCLIYSQTILQKIAATQICKDFSLCSDWNQ